MLVRGLRCRFLLRLERARKLREHESARSDYRVTAVVGWHWGALWVKVFWLARFRRAQDKPVTVSQLGRGCGMAYPRQE